MNYTLEELEKTWNFYDNSSKEIIDNAVDVSFKFINEDMLKDYDKYIKNNNFLVLFYYKKEH
ncbi:hypothetical protein [uncultured Brachyspira sp.]|jgi:hypothetical protein|uniref:hypothetical protein n=1 Tax=uncultured Brachyspira sp. TaxID=221953 RepID=UPI00258A156D|nr:hypothetical protein [uncultured Brachyspira sp.]